MVLLPASTVYLEGDQAGRPEHDLTGRVLHDEALAQVLGRNLEDVASDRRCLHLLELAVGSTTNHCPVAGSAVHLTNGVVVGEEENPASGPVPARTPTRPLKVTATSIG